MAVFLSNVCTFNSCGRKFPALQELIRHIEENHSYDYEQEVALAESANLNNALIPISCILRIFSNRSADADSSDRKTIDSHGASQSVGSTPTDGSEFDDDADSDSGQSSIDSWATANADSSMNPLNKYHQIMGSNASGGNLDENNNSTKLNGVKKEYICGFSGCNKQYQSSNSLSHHRRSVHKAHTMCVNGANPIAKPVIDEKEKKIFPCTMCSKIYKTSHGLKNHCNLQHNQMNNQVNSLNRPATLQQINGTNGSCNANLAITSNGGIQQIKHEMPAQVTSFVQINTNNTSIKTEISPSVKETLLNSLQNSINKSKGISNSLGNGKFIKLESSGNGSHTYPLSAELISDSNCPPVGSNVEVAMGETKLTQITIKSPPIISAPTLQQHLLSPIIPKVASS